MTDKTKLRETNTQTKQAEEKKPGAELKDQDLDKVSGGTCAGGKHIPEGTIIH